jgi:hypothetical protein
MAMKFEITVEPEYTITLTRREAEDLVFVADNEGYIRSKFSEVNVEQTQLYVLRTFGIELKKLGVRS